MTGYFPLSKGKILALQNIVSNEMFLALHSMSLEKGNERSGNATIYF